MENKNYIILIAIVILAIALICISVYIATPNNNNTTVNNNTTIENNTNNVIMIDKDGNVNNTTTHNNTNTSNETYRVYNPQTDSYVTVIGEGYDAEVDRWYTYDTDGVRYYNTRIK